LDIVIYILLALVALSVLVFFHELGHFSVAKLFGVKIERFSIGFGKILAKKQIGDTEWVISAIPLGGYVKMKGQDDSDPLKKNYDPDSYTSKKPWQRILILLAGPFANFLLAFFIYFVIALYGAPLTAAGGYIKPIVGKVAPNTPAEAAKLQKGDEIIELNGKKVKYWYEIGDLIQQSDGNVSLKIKRNNQILNLTLNTKEDEYRNEFNESVKRKIIGIAPYVKKDMVINFNLIEALKYAYRETINAALFIFKGVQKVTTGEVDSKNIGGALTIFDIIIKFAQNGFVYLLFIMALISVNLGVLNLLPIPALDGGHIMFNLYELITRRELNEKVYYYLTMLGWAFLMFIMFFGLYNDINRIFIKG